MGCLAHATLRAQPSVGPFGALSYAPAITPSYPCKLQSGSSLCQTHGVSSCATQHSLS